MSSSSVAPVGKRVSSMIELENIHRVFSVGSSEVRALDGIDLSLEAGEYVAVMGSSGSGKSTLMNILGCLDTPTEGRYHLLGHDVPQLDDDSLARVRNREVGFIFQSFNLLPRLSALKNVELPLIYAGVKPPERADRARGALQRIGLGDRVEHRPNQLSGGEHQRVAIARALVGGPSLLLADEPTGNLDSRTSREVMEIVDQLSASGATVVVVTHETEVAEHAQRRVLMSDGRIVDES